MPARTPPQILKRLETEVQKIVQHPDYLARIRELGYKTGGRAQADFAAQVRLDHARWAALVKKADKID